MTTSEPEVREETHEPIEYVKIDYRNLPRRRVQPTGHSKIYYLPNPKILPEQYKSFINAKIVLDSIKKISLINVIDFDQTNTVYNKLEDIIIYNNWCRKIPRHYIRESLVNNYGIIFISKNVIGMDFPNELLAFSTIKFVNDNRYKSYFGPRKGYLDIDLICANSQYKHMGTQILDILVDIAIKTNSSHIHLDALDEVVNFYKKYGFTEEIKPSIKEKEITSMDYKILSEQEYKSSSKYNENYGIIQEFGGRKKQKTTKNITNKNNKKRLYKIRRSKSHKIKRTLKRNIY